MGRLTVPSEPDKYTTKYIQFTGVDLSQDATQIEESRCAYAQNVIFEAGGYFRKRPGWETIKQQGLGKVHAIYACEINEMLRYIVHQGAKLYQCGELSDTWTEIGSIADGKSAGFAWDNRFYIIDGAAVRYWDGSTYGNVSDIAYVPTTSTGRSGGEIGGGELYEAVNLLSDRRKNTFIADGTSKKFKLDVSGISAVNHVSINGTATTAYTANLEEGSVTFTTAPEDSGGLSAIEITFSRTPEKRSDILACTFCGTAQYGNGVYFFLSGNPKKANADWHSGLNDPTYWPDMGYAYYGTGDRCMGYAQYGESLIMIKEDSFQPTVYLRTATEANNDVAFSVSPGVSGVGAISRDSIVAMDSETLFLSRRGVCAVTSLNIGSRTVIRNRSYFLDGMLLAERELENAVACKWQNRYILALNGAAYVLDCNLPRHYRNTNEADSCYEATYWTNIPAVCFLEKDGELYFGTEDGRICRMKGESAGAGRYSDDGEAVRAIVSTKLDTDGNFMLLKTLQKKGSGLLMKPFSRSSVEVFLSTTAIAEKHIKTATMDIFDWDDVDFDRFTFEPLNVPRVVPFLKKEKKYTALQFTLKNDVADEDMGILGIIKEYIIANYNKRGY